MFAPDRDPLYLAMLKDGDILPDPELKPNRPFIIGGIALCIACLVVGAALRGLG